LLQDDSGDDSGSDDGSSMDADGTAAKAGKPQRAAKKVSSNGGTSPAEPVIVSKLTRWPVLECLILGKPPLTGPQAAAAMAVGVGSFSDPADLQVCRM
jgi:hypothetical protein